MPPVKYGNWSFLPFGGQDGGQDGGLAVTHLGIGPPAAAAAPPAAAGSIGIYEAGSCGNTAWDRDRARAEPPLPPLLPLSICLRVDFRHHCDTAVRPPPPPPSQTGWDSVVWGGYAFRRGLDCRQALGAEPGDGEVLAAVQAAVEQCESTQVYQCTCAAGFSGDSCEVGGRGVSRFAACQEWR